MRGSRSTPSSAAPCSQCAAVMRTAPAVWAREKPQQMQAASPSHQHPISGGDPGPVAAAGSFHRIWGHVPSIPCWQHNPAPSSPAQSAPDVGCSPLCCSSPKAIGNVQSCFLFFLSLSFSFFFIKKKIKGGVKSKKKKNNKTTTTKLRRKPFVAIFKTPPAMCFPIVSPQHSACARSAHYKWVLSAKKRPSHYRELLLN